MAGKQDEMEERILKEQYDIRKKDIKKQRMTLRN